MIENTIIDISTGANDSNQGLSLGSIVVYELLQEIETRDARIAELEGLVDEFIAASSNLLPYTNVLNPYDGIRVPYWALKKLVQRARKERER